MNIGLDRYFEALAFAAEHHRYQRRAGCDALPYINHLIKVARVLIDEGNEKDPNVILAGILHDIIEDTEVDHGDLQHRYGKAVADIVAELTDDMDLPYAERKQLQIDRAEALSVSARKIRIADKGCNIADIFHYPLNWPEEKKIAYLKNSIAVVDRIRRTDPGLEQWFDDVVARVQAKL